jgi:uroporphyrinogen III methyltransferase/synthase
VAKRPLEGKRIVVTRPREQGEQLASALERLGATVDLVPLVSIEPVADRRSLDESLRELDRYDWVVFTSANGVGIAGDYAAELSRASVAAIGPATADALRALGVEPAFVPARFAGEEVGPGLEPLRAARVLVLQADIADSRLADELRRRGALVKAVTAYRTVKIEGKKDELAALRAADAVVLASGSAARSLAQQGGAGAALVVCIGPKTSDVASEAGLPVGLVARDATAEGIIQALTKHFEANE